MINLSLHSSKLLCTMKYIHLTLVCLGILSSTGCKKNTPEPVIEEEYFSFDANGKHYHYPQVKNNGFLGQSRTIAALKVSGSFGYKIAACWLDGNVERGRLEFRFGGFGIPDKDTVELSTVYIYGFFRFHENTYKLTSPYTGRMIFTERSATALRGTFELQAAKTTSDTLGYDSVLTITNGSFYIIPQ